LDQAKYVMNNQTYIEKLKSLRGSRISFKKSLKHMIFGSGPVYSWLIPTLPVLTADMCETLHSDTFEDEVRNSHVEDTTTDESSQESD